MKENRTPEQIAQALADTVKICAAKGWKATAQAWIFKSPSGSFHDLSAADLEKLDYIEKNNSFPY